MYYLNKTTDTKLDKIEGFSLGTNSTVGHFIPGVDPGFSFRKGAKNYMRARTSRA